MHLTCDRTYYVNPAGNDANDGLTAATPFQTIPAAFDAIAYAILEGCNVTIQLADGAYPEAILINKPWTGGKVILQGNCTSPQNTLISVNGNHAISIINPIGTLQVRDCKISTQGQGYCIRLDSSGLVEVDNLDFGACAYSHMKAQGPGATIRAIGNYKISGGALVHMEGRWGGVVETLNRTVTITNNPAFGYYFAVASRLGGVCANSMTFVGSATGPRYTAYCNGIIWTNGAGANYFPGNGAGVVQTGGQYV
jgi:hypothetical protein